MTAIKPSTTESTPATDPHSLGPGPAVFAFDVGGTTIKCGYVDGFGNLRGITRVASPKRGPQAPNEILDTVAEQIARFRQEGIVTDEPRAIGIGLPGILDDERGIGIFSENLGWRDFDFAAAAKDRFELPVGFIHDVRSAGLAEMKLGVGQGVDNAVVVALGTGIAAAIFIDGKPHVARGLAGEIGHAAVVPQGETCICGNQGCLEAIASAGAIARRYARATGKEVSGAHQVLEAAKVGDPVAEMIWESAIDALALSITQTFAALAPERIIIGGGLSEAGAALITPLQKRVAQLLRYTDPPEIMRANAGENAGLIGAALRGREVADKSR